MFRLKATDNKLFQLLEELADIIFQGTILIKCRITETATAARLLDELEVLKRRDEKTTDLIITKLGETFITPLDREDIYTLAGELNEITASLYRTVAIMVIYETGLPGQKFKDLVTVFANAASKVKSLVYCLRQLKDNAAYIGNLYQTIKKYQSLGDTIYRQGVADLFKDQKDAINVLKGKEVYEQMATTLDKCARVAGLIRGIVIKYD